MADPIPKGKSSPAKGKRLFLLEIALCLPGPALAGFALWGMGHDLHHSWCGNCAREIFIFAAGMCACAVVFSLGPALEKTMRPVSRLIGCIALAWVALVTWILLDGLARPGVRDVLRFLHW